ERLRGQYEKRGGQQRAGVLCGRARGYTGWVIVAGAREEAAAKRKGPRQREWAGGPLALGVPVASRRRLSTPATLCLASPITAFWLVIKEDGHMVTARQEPRLVLVSITYEDDRLILRAPSMDQLVLPSKLPSSNEVHDCRLFGLDIKGRDCGDEAAQWFTNFLKTEAFRLVQFEKNMKGRPSGEIFPDFVQNYYQVAYPDCSPVMILSEASLADLNTRLEKKVKMENFRPNIVVTGCDAFEEVSGSMLLCVVPRDAVQDTNGTVSSSRRQLRPSRVAVGETLLPRGSFNPAELFNGCRHHFASLQGTLLTL
ncbi:hypothetical protein HPG69_010208, partial [Diceros bicornis minor]